jgi:hypothetical protein
MSQNTMTIDAPATLSERDLLADVFHTEFHRYSATGKKQDSGDYALTLHNLLNYCDEYGELDDISPILSDKIFNSDQPELDLMLLIDAIEGMASEYKLALQAFRDFKADRLIEESDGDDCDQRFRSEVTCNSEIDEWIESEAAETAEEFHDDGQEVFLSGQMESSECRPKPRIRIKADGSFHFVH